MDPRKDGAVAYRDESSWAWSQASHNRRQSNNIEYLHGQLNVQQRSAAKARRALQSQLKQVSGDLSQRIDSLSRALDTFVALSDLRFDLQSVESGAPIRDRVRRFVIAATDSSEPPTLVLPEIDGYWLRPAGLAFAALLDGRDATAELTAARQIEARRTAMFLAVSLALAGRAEQAAEHLPAALGSPVAERTISHAQRGLWQAALDGFFGRAGHEYVQGWLNGLVLPVGDAENDKMWTDVIDRAMPAKESLDAPAQVRAFGQLTRIRDYCAEALSGNEPGPERPDPQNLFGIIEELVDEGTLEEAPLLRRGEALRLQIEERSADTAPPDHFDDAAGAVDKLLADILSDPKATPAARTQAVVLGMPHLRRLAEAVREKAAKPYTDDSRVVKRNGMNVRVTLQGPDPADLATSYAGLATRNPQRNVTMWAGGTIAASAALLAFIVLGAGPMIITALIAIAALGIKWFSVVRDNKDTANTVAQVRLAFDKDMENAGRKLTERWQQVEKAVAELDGTYAELVASLDGVR